MKKILTCFLMAILLSWATVVHAQYSSTAYGGNKNETFLERTSDWFATLGLSPQEKHKMKLQRRAQRKVNKAKKAIAKKKRAIAKQKAAYKR